MENTATKEYTKGEIEGIFAQSRKVEVVFVKKDGTVRTMLCTRDMDMVPEELRPKKDENQERINKAPDHLFPAFDLEKNAMRSFIIANVQSVRPVA